ncbi:glycosyltransferase family 39 protein [Umezawaea tangerina]|uniref:Dolichyl-phosphate-mannose-protein mannosyltransferase n=1 Tax=Umezawaea tangerina TaxID=84725 RepID=A0A2T0T9C8_9PSEU|nr:glycosyltransferase family 39 protein [Umezawaea tangerina]PRY42256.1 dolichyl-phosphate-mannose-protein mannosyltransferase [Umezawaea tangerina]
MSTVVEAPPRSRLVYGVAALVGVVLVAFAGGYGYHGDELYFVAAGRHLAWGYPDQPPLTPLLARLMDLVAPDSLVALRVPAAIAAGLTVLFVGLTAREMGGRPRAQLVAATGAAVSGLVLVPGHMMHTTTVDICLSAALTWLVVRVLRTGDERLLAVAGAVLGVGLLNKYQIAAVAVALVLGLAVAGPRGLLRSPWFAAGVLVALVMWAPNLWWQAQHGWPQLDMAQLISERGGNGARLAFVPLQLVYVSPFLAPLWIAGLVRLLRTPASRFLGVAYLLLAAAFIAAGGSALYLFGAYSALLAAGGLAVDGWLERGATGRRVAVGTALVGSAAFVVPLALPVVPLDRLSTIPVVKLNGLTAEQFGWPELAETVASVHRGLPPGQREHAVVLTENFGEAAALERYGPALGLPAAYSGYRGYADWGPPPETATTVLLVRPGGKSDPPAWAVRACRGGVRQVATTDNDQGVKNKEQGGRVWLCTDLGESWAALWPGIRHLD